MKKSFLSLAVASLLTFSFSGCGGGSSSGGSSGSTLDNISHVVTSTGTLSDSVVGGITYACGSDTNVTDSDGKFIYNSDCSEIQFSVGNVTLGSIRTSLIPADGIIYPADLLGLDRSDTNSTQIVNVLQVLQSLDSDGNPYNGISIESSVVSALSAIPAVNLDGNVSGIDVSTIVSDANKTLVPREYAIAHYEDTLRKNLHSAIDTVPPAPAIFAHTPLPTNGNTAQIILNGEVGAKVFVNGVDTGVVIDENNTATVDLNTTGLSNGQINFDVTLEDDTNQTGDVFTATILKDTTVPIIVTPASYNSDENQVSRFDINATDDSSIIYSISGNDADYFNINSSTGAITFKQAPDYETKTSYILTVVATDEAGNAAEQAITININNLNDVAPLITTNSDLNADENQLSAFTLTSTDGDGPTDFIYTISGTDSSDFDINSTTGVVSFKQAPDYETKSRYDLNATVSDGENNFTKEFHIHINNLNDVAPVITTNTVVNVNENQLSALSLSSTDGDGPTNFTYTISGTDANSFDINSTTGVITFKQAPDYETRTVYDFNVTVSDGINSTTQETIVNIENLDDVIPSFISNDVISVDENTHSFNIEASDDYPLTYSLANTEDSNLFTINEQTGEVSFVIAPDYENPIDSNFDNNYTLSVKISDTVPAHTQTKQFVVSVNNLDDVPTPAASNGMSLSGIVSDGAAVANAHVYIEDKNRQLRNVLTDASGRFTFDISGLEAPYILMAILPDYSRLYSYNDGNYAYTNVTPITSLVMSNMAHSLNTNIYDMMIDFSTLAQSDLSSYFTTAYNSINANLADSLSAALLTGFNHFYNQFSYTGFNYDRVIAAYDMSLSDSDVALRINNNLLTTISDSVDITDINATGRVLDENGIALINATVNVYYYINGIRYDITTTTDSNGEYIVTMPRFRTYDMQVISDLLQMNYSNLSTFYADLARLNVQNVNLVTPGATVAVSGSIKNARTSSAIASVRVKVREGYNNRNGSVISEVVSDGSGHYSIPSLASGNYTFEISKDGYYPLYVNEYFSSSSSNTNFSLIADSRTSILDRDAFASVVLTWGSLPSDLDSHLYIASDESNTRNELYYGRRAVGTSPSDVNNPCATAGTIASLDMDDTSSYGPETTTICQRYSYPAHFFVHNYSGGSYDEVSAEAKVVVRKFDGTTYEITPPSTNPSSYRYWKVFDIDSSGNIIPISEYSSSVLDN